MKRGKSCLHRLLSSTHPIYGEKDVFLPPAAEYLLQGRFISGSGGGGAEEGLRWSAQLSLKQLLYKIINMTTFPGRPVLS